MPPEPDHYRYGGGASVTTLHPIVLVAMLIAIVLVLGLPRRFVPLPLLAIAFLTPIGQQVYLAGVHWFALRLVILAGLIRVFVRKETRFAKSDSRPLPSIDKPMVFCILAQAICVVLLFHDTGSLVNQVGFIWDMWGAYFLLRVLIRSESDMYLALKCLAILTIPIAIGMVIEQEKMVNIFGQLGGIAATPEVREGKIRSQGVFTHSLMAGSFAATQIPLFLLLWKNGKSWILGVVGLVGASVMTLTSNSSTPLLALAAGLLCLFFWPLRKKMRMIRWGIVGALFVLNIAMKAPIWFLIARVDLTGGSSSYHRAELIDEFVNHFSNWWLIGTADNGSWGLDMFDVQNQYVNIGETGGLVALVCFVIVIIRCFARLGSARKRSDGNRKAEWTIWLLGCALFANIVAFFGVNYFDQSRIGWLILLVFIEMVTAAELRPISTTRWPQRRTASPTRLSFGRDELKYEDLRTT